MKFNVVIEKDEDGYYVGTVPSLPGCHTQAKSLDELLERVKEAIELYLEPYLRNFIKKAEINDKTSVNEVLLELSKGYEIHLGEKRKLSEIPDKVTLLVNSLETDIFPKKLGS